jgi:hypothetical protein
VAAMLLRPPAYEASFSADLKGRRPQAPPIAQRKWPFLSLRACSIALYWGRRIQPCVFEVGRYPPSSWKTTHH